jgi:hypothetical protein
VRGHGRSTRAPLLDDQEPVGLVQGEGRHRSVLSGCDRTDDDIAGVTYTRLFVVLIRADVVLAGVMLLVGL